jgi:hypothetical protein
MEAQLLLRSLIPLGFIAAVPLITVGLAAVRQGCGWARTPPLIINESARAQGSLWSTTTNGFMDGVPASLILAFCFTPSVSAAIFRAWYCVSFYYDEEVQHYFLAGDLTVRCMDSSPEYTRLTNVAWILVALWPIGMLVVYTAMLLPCGKTLIHGEPATPLVRATAFLHIDYKPHYFWWEIVSLFQRTVVTGWLMLFVDTSKPVLRLLSAILVSFGYLIALLSCKPCRRALDNVMAVGEQVLFVCLFIGALLVCLYEDIANDSSPELAYRYLGLRSSDEAYAYPAGSTTHAGIPPCPC